MSGVDAISDPVSDGGADHITVSVAGQVFGLPIDQVHDVFRPANMTRVALASAEVAGVLNMRGRIVTALDMRRCLDLPPRSDEAPCMAVGIERGGESYGLVVDSVGEVLSLRPGAMEPPPVNLDTRWGHVVSGVHRLEGALLVILDVRRLLERLVGGGVQPGAA
jgi:purine-binding chemotaxis protein CheW